MMTFKEFEAAVTGPLGYKSTGMFADQTKLMVRATLTKWKRENVVPPQIEAYIRLRLDCEAAEQLRSVIGCAAGRRMWLGGDDCLFDGDRELRMHTIDNENFAPEYNVGDIVLGVAWSEEVPLSDGFWIFDAPQGRRFGMLQCLFNDTYRLYGNSAYTEDFALGFGKEHLRKGMRPVAKVKYHIKKKG